MKRDLLLVLTVVGALVAPPPRGPGGRREPAEEGAVDLAPDEVAEAKKEGQGPPAGGGHRRQRLPGRAEDRRRPGHDERHHRRDPRAARPARTSATRSASVPGVNVIQTGARDVNLTARQATSTLATSQLVAVDGRSVYLDFFGLVLWDFVPSPSSGEIKQIEVVRGPASVVWGANAVNGVVNIITKTPRANEGLGIILAGGPLRPRRGLPRVRGERVPVQRRVLLRRRRQRHLVVQAERRLLLLGAVLAPGGQVPLDCHPLGVSPVPHGHGRRRRGGFPLGGASYPADANRPGRLRERRDEPAQVRPARRPGPRERRPHHLRGRLRRHRGDHPHRHRALQPPERLVHGLRPRGLQQGRAARRRLRQPAGRRGPEPAAGGPRHPGGRSSSASRPRPTTSRSGNTTVLGGSHVADLRRQRPAQQLRHHPRPGPRTATSSAPTASRSTSSTSSASRPASASTSSATSTSAVCSPRVSLMFKPTPDQSIRAVLQPGVRVALVHQQLPGPEHPVPDAGGPHAPHPAPAAAAAAPGAAARSS